jgi:hypothetical protein
VHLPDLARAAARVTARVLRGLLGWSNKRTGLEFYRYDERTIPRHGSEWGDLLALEQDFPAAEGSPVVVIVLPRQAALEDVERVERQVREVLG